jgi:acylphosphatase
MSFISKARAGSFRSSSNPTAQACCFRSILRQFLYEETTMDDRQKAVQARVHGKVQGVGYRIWARREAIGLGLVGWVRNERDGTVMALIAGTDTAVSAMIERLWQGPEGASVSKVEVIDVESSGAPADFRIMT